MAVADSFDAIVSNRPYKNGQSHRNALIDIKSKSDTLYDPKVINALEILLYSLNDWEDSADEK